MNSLDLGRTDLVNHHIQLDYYTPIKDRYHRIPPHQYEEVQKHLKEMLDIGAIRHSTVHGQALLCLCARKMGFLDFA